MKIESLGELGKKMTGLRGVNFKKPKGKGKYILVYKNFEAKQDIK